MAKTKRKPKAQKTTPPRECYHGPLITNGVSLGYLKIYPWLNLPFSIFAFLAGGYNDHLGIIKRLFLICIIINVVSILFSFFHSLVNRLKSLAYVLIALVTWTTLMWIDFIGLMIFISDGSAINAKSFYNSPLTLFYVIPILLLFFVFCGIYSWYYQPKNQGKIWQFNHRETKDKKGEFAHNFWITFGAVLFVPALLTGYLQNIFGVFLGLLFTATLPAVIVDAVYAAIYIRKYPEEKEQV
ncbi:hypothetical protein [Streptococcus mutans]|uniref:hypothetical protein n=2 Tax=Streptococcus mutans TaxID=1309 RepID=UPI0014551730|nr:hypothetical protein [Streptococcus mutans]MCB5001825.1 hypothetical protein [Streptococcus mutans]MCB5078623.1 hypothetical protein [Streptococcus mutans]MCB5128554.1 hypothetical protein [Streptococcus mutans]MCB5130425.1 hypothetical protein [Streptococcus mutans]MCB5141465.1 hypothetical protein [Streptococcus mutans]